MTYKQIEASRNARLWLTQIGLPVATLAVTTIIAFPEARKAIANKAVQIKKAIKSKSHKEKHNEKIIIQINAKDRTEALSALEVLAKDVFENYKDSDPVKKIVRIKG
jgi:hypothetical protein